jgi:hypothetical protein
MMAGCLADVSHPSAATLSDADNPQPISHTTAVKNHRVGWMLSC